MALNQRDFRKDKAETVKLHTVCGLKILAILLKEKNIIKRESKKSRLNFGCVVGRGVLSLSSASMFVPKTEENTIK